ncbi:MAG TPA: ATP-binding cassette domain-containing protein, partial [Trueperaceae bacterium]
MAVDLLEMRGIAKHFGGALALDGVDFSLAAGEVHALVGENGAGKSTLMKILSGAQKPDAGTISLEGRTVSFHGVSDAQRRGVVMVYQELELVPDLSIAENLFLGRLPSFVRSSSLRTAAQDFLRRVGLDKDPMLSVRRLGVGEQQLVVIARALVGEARILILDEPTAALSAQETERLFGIVRSIREQGVGVIYISHRLEEIFAIADRVTVLRDGRRIATEAVSGTSPAQIVQQMVGRHVESYQREHHEGG